MGGYPIRYIRSFTVLASNGPPPKASPLVPNIAFRVAATVNTQAATIADQKSHVVCLFLKERNLLVAPTPISISPCVIASICAIRHARLSLGMFTDMSIGNGQSTILSSRAKNHTHPINRLSASKPKPFIKNKSLVLSSITFEFFIVISGVGF